MYFFLIGPSSYKEHCHRMLRIWVDSLPPTADAVQELTDALEAINKRKVAGTGLYTFIFKMNNMYSVTSRGSKRTYYFHLYN